MLESCGFEAFLIGGSVRDFIMGRDIGDIDVTTSATPDEVKEVFSRFRVIETGIKHGTVTVLIENEPVEITTYRSEGSYSDNRHPDSVSFSKKLADDITRRDFTMNGIAYNFEKGFVDLTGGIEDIKSETIRCIGDPEARFREDALRILRAVRFSSVLGFTIEENTKKAIHRCRGLLKNISAERIRDELCKLITGKNVYSVLTEFYDVIGVFIPELLPTVGFEQVNRHHIYDVYTHTLKALEQSKPDLAVRLALLFHDMGKVCTVSTDESGEMHFYSHPRVSAEMTEEIMTRLRFDNNMKKRVVDLVQLHDCPISVIYGGGPNRKCIKRLMSKLGDDRIFDLIEVKRCDNFSHAAEYVWDSAFFTKAFEMIDEIIRENECLTVKDLKIDGNDLMKMGYSGREIGEKLNMCLNAVLEEKVENNFDELRAYVKASPQERSVTVCNKSI